ncbi:MAG: hypothetical protein EOR45_37800 [Mesorhizobium sp.]|nr:MAG: hypothetical protein EOR45_37800 [Mesorhizobium sp.]
MMLKGVLQIAGGLDALPYLDDEPPNVLIESFAPFYVQRLCLFKNSQHIFDVEEVVKAYLERTSFIDGDDELKHFRFSDFPRRNRHSSLRYRHRPSWKIPHFRLRLGRL